MMHVSNIWNISEYLDFIPCKLIKTSINNGMSAWILTGVNTNAWGLFEKMEKKITGVNKKIGLILMNKQYIL